MSPLKPIAILSATAISAFLFSLTPATPFLPQFIALISVILILISLRRHTLNLYLTSLIINLIVFNTQGLASPFFFLIYFLLFVLAFNNPPSTTLAYSLVLVILLSQSLDSLASLLPLFSLVFISPLAWYVGRQYLDNLNMTNSIAKDETDILLFFSLKFKNHILEILDSVSLLLSNPKLTQCQKDELGKIKKIATGLLKSSQKLTQQIDQETDEN
ncbi:MAG: hypothetical protein ACOX6N_00755 [Patescibacteria group bacterium]|jgi:hypothetical protein